VTYRFYKARNYVTHPSDSDHQSLVVSVPVRIDGRTVHASSAPIVLANAVGGYMPSSVADAAGVGQARLEMIGMGGASMSFVKLCGGFSARRRFRRRAWRTGR
jgi:hypothetical protein